MSPTMPRRNSREAPRFSSEKPNEILRFFTACEELFSECGVTDPKKKKEHVCSYADYESEEEWRILDKFASGTYEEWKKEVLEQYAEAENLVNGTLHNITALTKKFRGLGVGDTAEFMQLKRRWVVESAKLQQDPPLLSNREEVALFFKCFDSQVRELIMLRLSQLPPEPVQAGQKAKRREDLHKMSKVMEVAENIMKGVYGNYTYNKGSTPTLSQTLC